MPVVIAPLLVVFKDKVPFTSHVEAEATVMLRAPASLMALSQFAPIWMAFSVPAPAVIPPMLMPFKVPALAPVAVIFKPFWVMVEAKPAVAV